MLCLGADACGQPSAGVLVRSRLAQPDLVAAARGVLPASDPGAAHGRDGVHVLGGVLGGVARDADALPHDERPGAVAQQARRERAAVQEAAPGARGRRRRRRRHRRAPREKDPQARGGQPNREAGETSECPFSRLTLLCCAAPRRAQPFLPLAFYPKYPTAFVIPSHPFWKCYTCF